jgi:spore coat protein U-like protein
MSPGPKYLWVAAALLSLSHSARAAECRASAQGVMFGMLRGSPGNSSDTGASIIVTCYGRPGERVAYSLKLSTGQGSFHQRQMQSGTAKLAYNLYLDAARTQVWGDGTDNTGVLSDAAELAGPTISRQYPVYGRVFSGRESRIGMYSDTVTVVLDY